MLVPASTETAWAAWDRAQQMEEQQERRRGGRQLSGPPDRKGSAEARHKMVNTVRREDTAGLGAQIGTQMTLIRS